MTKKEALEIMCQRCSQHPMCMGTGCTPKKVLEEGISNDQ